jgi:GLPGLI family protein
MDYDSLDESNLRVAYSLEYIWNVERPSSKCSDVLYLDIGRKMSKCYSYQAFTIDSIVTIEMTKGNMDSYLPAREALPMDVCKNYLESQIKVIYRMPDDVFLYSDDYCNFNWEIHADKKIILGYSCQKATTTFRGRTWEAWFTIDIPVSDGPWKFCGLSGLILEIVDAQKHFTFTCTGIEKKQTPIVMYDWDYEKTTREKLNALLMRFYENPKNYFERQGIMVIIQGDSNSTNPSFPYNPIELE